MGITASSVVLRLFAAVFACCVCMGHLHAGEPELGIVPARVQVEPGDRMPFLALVRGPGGGFAQQLRWSATGGQIAGLGPIALYTAGRQTGVFQVRVQKGNGKGAPQATAQVKIGYAPTAQSIAVTTAAGQPVAFTLAGADRDGDALSYIILTQPRHGVLSGSGAARSYAPTTGFTGSDGFWYTVTDGWSYASPARVSITVTPASAIPVITSLLTSTATVGTPFTYAITATNTPTSFGAAPLPSGLAVSTASGAITGTPTVAGPAAVTITATNGAGTDTETLQLTVTPGTPTVTWAAPAAIVYGAPLSAAQLNATGTPAGTFAYAPAVGAVLTAGTHTLTATFTPNDVANWSSVSASTSIQVQPAVPVLTWLAPAPITYGTVLSDLQLQATASFQGSPLPGSWTYTPAAGTVLTAGDQVLTATFTPADAQNFLASSVTTNVQVEPATPTLAWAAPAAITYGTPLSATQLQATAIFNGGSVDGAWAYDPAAGTVLSAGVHTLTATFSPSDAVNLRPATVSTTITVTQAQPVIAWAAPAPIIFGTPLSAAELNASASFAGATVSGSWSYTPAAGTILDGGPQALQVVFTPVDTVNLTAVTATTTITVTPATPLLAWTAPAAIVYGTPLGAAQLQPTATFQGAVIGGDWTFTPTAGTVLDGGVHTLTATFAPSNTTNFSSAVVTTTLDVLPAMPVTTWPQPAPITYGTGLGAAQLQAAATWQGVAVAGTWTYAPAAGALLGAGTHALTATFAPTNTVNFSAATAATALVVAPATPTLAWTQPAPIGIDEALSGAQLNPTATFGGQILEGSWTFAPGMGASLPAGSQILQATFAPADTTNFTSSSIQVTIQVLDRAPTISVAPQVTPSPITGQTGTLAVGAADDGGAAGLTYQWTSTGPAAVQVAPNGTADAQAAVATFAAAGSYTITVTVTDATGQFASAAVPVDVVATPTLVAVTPPAVTIAAGAQTTLTAAVRDQFNAVMSAPSGLAWGVTGDATVAANGLEAQVTGAAGGGTATVTATLGTLSASSAITIQPPEQGTTVTIAATTPETTEGQADAPAILTVNRTGDVTAPLTVAYTVSGTATSGSDYTALSGVVTVPAGAHTATIGVVALSDTVAEADETVVVTLGAGAGYAIGSPDTATAIIHSPVRPAVAFAAATSAAREDAGNVQIQVKLNRSTTVETRIGYAVTGGTATAGIDFTAVAGELIFPAGSTTQAIAIPAVNDAISDPSETIVLTLAGPIGLDLGSPLAHTLTLLDTQPTRLRVDAVTDTVAENDAGGSAFRFSRTGEPSADLTFTLYWYGTAVAGTHFIENRPTSITIPAGQSAVDVAIVPIDNATIGDDVHLYPYILSVPTGTPVDQLYDYLYILDDEVPVLAGRLEPAQLYEGSASYVYVGLANEQGQPVARHTPVTIAWNINGTGIDAGDLTTPLSGTVTTYQDYASWSYVYVVVRNDGVEEGPEPFLVTLTAGALSGQVTGTLNDLASIAITLSTATISETATEPAIFRFVRSGSTSGALTVPITWSYYTTATPGVDFVGSLPSSIEFTAGQTEATVPIQPIDDAVIESDKRVGLYVSGGTGFAITYPNGTPSLALLDDETPIVSVSLQPADIYEGSGSYAYIGLRDANGQLISRASAQTIAWQITGPQATDWSAPITGTLSTYPNYAYEQYIYLAAVADGVEDGPEPFTLTAALGASSGQASGSILDRAIITLSVSAPTVAEESGEEVRFVIARTGVTSQPTTVSLYWSSAATSGSDFSGSLPTSATIPAGATSAVVAITPINDAVVESDETISLYVYSTTAYGVSGPSTVTTTVLDDETPLLTTAFDYAINAEGQTAQCTIRLVGTNGNSITRQRSTDIAYALTGIDAADVNQALSGTVTVPAGYQYGSCAIGLAEDGITEGIENATFTATVGSSTASASLSIIELGSVAFAPSTVQVQEPGYGQTDVTVYASLVTGWEVPETWEANVSVTQNEEGTASWYSYWNYGSYDLLPYNDYWNSWVGVTDDSFSVPVASVNADDVYEGGPQGIPEQAYADLSAITFRNGSLSSPTFYLYRSKALTISIQDKVHATIAIQSPTPQQTIVGSTVPVAFTVAADQPLQEVRVNGTVIASGSVTPGPMTATVTLPNLGANTIRIWVVSAQGAVVQATVGVHVLPATIPVIFVAPTLDADGVGTLIGAPVARAFAETAGESNLTVTATVEPEGQPTAATPAIATWDGQYIQVYFGEQVAGRYVLRLAVATSDGSRSGTAVATIVYDPAGWTPDPTTNPIIIQHPQNGSTLTFFGAP